MARRGFGDEMWRLATAGDVASLVRAALLVDGYDASRARAHVANSAPRD